MKNIIVLTGILLMLAPAIAIAADPPKPAPQPQRQIKRIRMEDFFRTPKQASYTISPNGEHYAFLQPWGKRFNIHVKPISGDVQPTRITAATARDIRTFGWKTDDRIVYLQDTGGDENYHVYAVGKDGSNLLDVTPYEGVRASIVDMLEHDENHMLIGLNLRTKEVFDVYKININNGQKTLVIENPGNVVGWRTDNDGNLRIAYVMDGTTEKTLYRETQSEDFKEIFSTDFKDTLSPIGFTADNKNLYIISNIDKDKTALYEYNPQTAEQTLVYENPNVDVGGFMWSKYHRKLLGVYYYTDKIHRHYFDKDYEKFYQTLQNNFPNMQVGIRSTSKNEEKMIITVASDRVAGRLYYYDKNDPQSLKLLIDLYPWLPENDMAPMTPISYKSRDGLTIHGYLTLPTGQDPKNLPVVVMPHGGPESRNHWGYNPEVQFLANRGMAVLQMNFRVSTGYGKSFWMAGFKQWGLKQQDDITDGTLWLIEQGIADPKRIAIYGASYGGYATLMGLIKHPELYAAGVDYVGVSNLFSLFDSIPPYWKPLLHTMYEKIGNPQTDAEQFKATSPVFLADKIQAPLFIAQGANDPRVVKDQSDQMVKAMRERGVEVEYMVKDNEGHGFSNQENRFDFYRAMEKFLMKHLKIN